MNPVALSTDPGLVLNLQQKDFSPNDVKTAFYWVPPDNSISRFHVRWWIDGQDPHTVPTSIPSFTLHNLKSACQYSIQVSCVMFVNDEERSGVWSDVKTFGTSPNPPSRLTVCPGPHSPSTSFLIKYTDENATGKKYVIEVTNLNGEVKQKSIQTEDLFALVDGLSPGGPYSVAVTCIKSGIRSLPCKLEVEKRTVPGKVAELRGQRSSTTSKTICWDKVIGANAYIVKWRKIDGNFQSTSTKETQITLQYLDSGKNYEVCVAAENATGTGDFSDAKQFSTDLASPSNLKTVIKYSGDNARAEVDFTAVGGQETKQYLVKLTPDGSSGEEDEERPPKVIPFSTTHAVFTHLDHGSCFVSSVIAIGENGVESKEVSGPPIWTRPAPVQGLFSKTVSGSAEEIKWKEGKGVSSYIVLVQEEGKDPEPQREITENRIMLNNLSLNTKFAVSVAAKNEGGDGRFSAPINFLTALAPPANIVVKNHPDYPEIGIIATWKECSGATQYIADLIENTTNKKVVVSRVQKECRTEFWKHVKAGHQYKVALQSIVQSSNDKRSSEIVYSDSIWTYCDRVQGLEVRLVSSSVVDITWSRTEEAENDQITCKARNGKIIKEKAETNQFTMTNLELGETYTITIAAWNKAGVGKESEPKVFRTGFSQPSQVKIEQITPNSAKIQFTAPKNKPPMYSVLVMPLSAGEGMQPEVVKQNHCIVRNLEPGIEHQVQVWSCDLDSPHLDSEKTVPQYFITAAPPVKGIKVAKDSPVSRNAMWEPAPGSSFYIPKLRKAGYPPIVMDATEECECHLENLDLHSNYTFSVTAQNDGGKSKESDKINFETELNPPKRILVANDKASPTTDLNIQVQEPDIPGFNYRLRIICLNGEPDEFVTITRQEATSVKKICDLTPGNSYQLAVCSLHDKDENLNSKEIFSDVIQTKTPPLTFYLQKISNIKYKITWCAIVGVTGYTIHFRKQYGDWIIKRFQPDENETILKDLEHGQIYEIKVFAVNESGPGQESQIEKFTTGPSTPTELNAEAISTREMKFSCKKTQGATEYIFDVNGEKYQEKDPELLLQHTKNDKEFDFKVSASNEGGCSDPSDTSHCSQTLLKLQQKSWKKANDYNTKFIIPMLSEVPSGNHADDFGRDEFQVGFGNTVCISGTHFSGKTSCALHYLQNLPKNLLPIFLDWDLYKGKKEKCDIKSVLLQQMKDFQESEKEFAFQWMKSHPDQVVFVVDDLALPHKVAGEIKLYDNVASVEEIFYSLVTTERGIFTQSQVLCSTSQSDLKQIIKPNRALQIDGFDTVQISKMKKMEFGEEIPLPKHLEYFCKNPSFCMIILQLLKNKVPSVDMQSYSSVLIKIMIDSVSRYPDGKKKEKLRDLWKEIQDIPRKLKTAKIDPAKLSKKSKSTSSTASFTQRARSQITDAPSFADFQENAPTKHCCTTLHDNITKALYFGLICPLEEFKSRFHKKSIKLAANANIWILAVGLLREHTTNLAAEVFSAIGHHLNVKEMGKKLEFTKNFVKENRDLIHKQMSSDCQITLDWLDIINETEALDIIPRSDWKVSVKKSHKTAEIEQMASFLCQVRGIFFNHIRVKMEKDLSPEARIPIDSAMKNNPDGEICANDSASTGRFSRNALNLSFRSKGRRPSGKPDLHSTLNSMEDDEDDAVFGGNLSTSDDQTSHSQEEQRLSDSKDELKDASVAADTQGQKESGPI